MFIYNMFKVSFESAYVKTC